MDEKRSRGVFNRALLGQLFLVGSVIVFLGGVWLATFVYTDTGAFCMFLGIMPLSLLMFCTGYLLSEAEQRESSTAEMTADCIDNKAFIAQFFKSMSIEK